MQRIMPRNDTWPCAHPGVVGWVTPLGEPAFPPSAEPGLPLQGLPALQGATLHRTPRGTRGGGPRCAPSRTGSRSAWDPGRSASARGTRAGYIEQPALRGKPDRPRSSSRGLPLLASPAISLTARWRMVSVTVIRRLKHTTTCTYPLDSNHQLAAPNSWPDCHEPFQRRAVPFAIIAGTAGRNAILYRIVSASA